MDLLVPVELSLTSLFIKSRYLPVKGLGGMLGWCHLQWFLLGFLQSFCQGQQSTVTVMLCYKLQGLLHTWLILTMDWELSHRLQWVRINNCESSYTSYFWSSLSSLFFNCFINIEDNVKSINESINWFDWLTMLNLVNVCFMQLV